MQRAIRIMVREMQGGASTLQLSRRTDVAGRLAGNREDGSSALRFGLKIMAVIMTGDHDPAGWPTSFKEAMIMRTEMYHTLKGCIKKKYGQDACNVGDVGGFAPSRQAQH